MSKEIVSKTKIVRSLYKRLNKLVRMDILGLIYEVIIDYIIDEIKAGRSVSIDTFGTFSIIEKDISKDKRRIGKTGFEKYVVFRANDQFKKMIKERRELIREEPEEVDNETENH